MSGQAVRRPPIRETTANLKEDEVDMYEDEGIVEWEDGSEWALSWTQDAGAFFAQRWFLDEDDDHHYIECPGPDLGLFESLETLEAAMGRSIPNDIKERLLSCSKARPITQEALNAWGVSVEYEIERLAPDGEIVGTYAPPGAANPFERRWLPEWM